MDDDSQDEVIKKDATLGKIKRTNALLFSDSESSDGNSGNSDDTGSEEEDTDEDGGEEDEEGEDEDLEDSEEDEEEEDDIEIAAEQPTHLVKGKPQLNGGAAASSDEDAEKCPICLNTLRDQEVGTPENCAHYFCSDCIVEWSKNANSCPVDRMSFKFICIREHFGGAILKKVPVENTQSQEDEVEDDPTFCEVCGRSDREDRLLLCDGCDAGYHMECLNPPMSEVPVAEWFCPPCTLANAGRVDDETDHVSEEEVAFLRADVVPSTSRLRPNVRTRAIARTRQSERVRATVNRNRITTAQRIQHVPRYLMSSLDETIETVAAGLSTAVYQRPLTPRAPSRRKRKVGRRRKRVASKKRHTQSSVGKKSTGTWIKRRKRRTKRRRVKKIKLKTETTARSRIAKTLRLGKPVHSTSIPSMHKPTEPSLGLLRADIGAASLSVFGDPFEFDPYDSDEEFPVNSASPLSAKRRVLSQSALRSHCPVARPVAVGLPGSSVPSLIPEPEAASADLLGTILAGQTRLMMSSSDVVINRDGSLTTKKVPRLHANSVSNSKAEESSEDGSQPGASQLGTPVISSNDESLGSLLLNTNSRLTSSNTYSASLHIASKAVSPLQAPLGKAPIKFEYSMTPRSVQTHNLANLNRCTPKLGETSRFNGNVPSVDPHSASSKLHSNSRSFTKTVLVKQPFKPIPKRPDISELPRIPKIKKEENSGHLGSQSASGDVPSSCITQLTGKGSTNQPIRDSKMESGKSNATQHRSCASGGSLSANTVAHSSSVCSPSIGKAGSSSFESFKINIPGNVGHSSRLSNPGFCNTFRPVDNKAQQKEKNSPFFSLKKAKPVKSEIYDPFDPTGSDSSSANSSPERLPLTNITRTISIASPQIQTFQTVRRITHYTLENIFGSGADLSDVPSGNTESHDNVMIQERLVKQISDTEQENVEEESSNISFPSSAIKQVPDEEHLNEDDKDNTRIVFEDDHGKPRVKMELDSPIWDEHQNIPKNGQAEKTSFSRSPSNSSFWNQKKFKKEKATTKEFKCTRSQSRSRDRSSSSTSRSVEESYSKSHKVKSKDRQSSSDHSSSHERSQKKKAKNKTKNKKSSWAKEHRRSRSRSSSPGNSPVEFYESRKKKHSSSRAKGRERSRSNSTDRSKKKKHRRERCYDRYEKERTSRRRSRSREKRRKRSRSPSASGYWELKGTKSRERSLQSRSCSKEIKWKPKETPPLPLQEKDHRSSDDNIDNSFEYDPSSKQEPEEMMEETLTIYQEPIPVQEIPPKGNTVEADLKESIAAERICEKFISDAVLSRSECSNTRVLPDSIEYFMKMELTDSNNSLELSSQNKIKLEEISIKEEDNDICPFLIDFPVEKEKLEQEPVETAIQASSKIRIEAQDGDIVLGDNVADVNKPEIEACAQDPALKSKALVKRVTWNLQEEEDDIVAVEKTRVPFCKQRMKEGVWKAEDLTQTINQVQLTEPPPTNYMIPEPMFPDLDSSQVYNQNLPLTAPLPSGLPPYAPVSQPTVQFIMQGSLPLLSCVAGQGLTPEPGNLATASEPGTQAASTGEMEEKVKALKSPVDKTKNEEYMKKLHMQERAVEEVKLAIKPFYQRREISKEEYKEILRKAVQKICHSKSGEINPVKVANLVKAYVEKYKHMRKHKKTDPEEELHEMGN